MLVEVALGESEVTEFELRGNVVAQIGVHDTQRVEIRDMVTAHLVCTNQQLYLSGTRHVSTSPHGEMRRERFAPSAAARQT